MESRIILSTADFSQNNIGRYVELSELTKKVLAKQTQYSQDSNEAIALNTFLLQLIEGGFIGGDNPLIKDMFIPALASGHDELLYNIAYLDVDGYPTNGMSQTEQEAETKLLTTVVDGDRVIGIAHSSSPGNVGVITRIFDGLIGHYYPSHSYVLYGNINNDIYDNIILVNNALNYQIYIGSKSSSLKYINQPTNKVESVLTMPIEIYGFTGLSLVKEGDTTYSWEGIIDSGTVGTSLQEGDKWNNIKIQENSNSYNFGSAYTATVRLYKSSFLAFADYINSTKMAELKGYVTTLMTALHVA